MILYILLAAIHRVWNLAELTKDTLPQAPFPLRLRLCLTLRSLLWSL
jgi:hypothetical protein